MNTDIAYSVIVPVYNGEHSLYELCDGIISTLNSYTFEIIFVDDHSTDNSWSIIRELKNKYPLLVKGLRLQKNYGQLAATSSAFGFCNGGCIITIDDDLQYDPKDILLLIDTQKKTGAELVYGNVNRKAQSAIRNLGGSIVRRISKALEGKDTRYSSFRLIDKTIAKRLAERHTNSFISMDNVMEWYSGSTTFVNVTHRPRITGASGYNLIKLIRLYIDISINHSIAPLRLMTQFGFAFSIIFFIRGLWFIYQKMLHNVQAGYTSIIVSILFCSSVIVFCLGVIGQYIFKLHITQQNKPLHSIKDII